MKECLWCKKDISEMKESAKFCSTSCRVMYNHKFGAKNQIKPYQAQIILGQINEALAEFKGLLKSNGMSIRDLNQPTNQIKPITDHKPATNTSYFVEPEKPSMPTIDAYKADLKEAKTIPQVEEILKRAKIDTFLLWQEKKELEGLGKELTKEMYND